MKAVIPVGGRGTRFQPWTLKNSKELIPIFDPRTGKVRATIDLVVEEAQSAGLEQALMITSVDKSGIKDHLTTQQLVGEISSDIRLHYTDQKEPRGLGDAILCAESYIGGEPFVVLLGDDFHDKNPVAQMLSLYEKVKGADFGGIITMQKVSLEEAKRYGVLDLEKDDNYTRIKDVEEKPDYPKSGYVITGRYLLSGDVFNYLKKTKPGALGELQLTDAIKMMMPEKYFYAVELDGERYDVGEPAAWFKTVTKLGSRFYK